MPISPRLMLAALALAATGVLAGLGGCATNPVTGGTDIVTMSEAQEIELGRKMHPQILQQYGRFDDEQLQQLLINLLQNEVRPILHATNETVNTLRGTAEFLGENVVEPVIKLNGYLAGLTRMLELIGINKKK